MQAKGKPLDLSAGRAGARPVAVRGGTVLHRGAGVARRRGGQGREPEGRRSRPRASWPSRADDSFYFLIFNANKKSLTVDLKSRGRQEARARSRGKADVFVENFAPGAIERLGLGYDVVSKINPGIIYAQVKGFGEGSPYENNLAFDMIAQAVRRRHEHHRRARTAARSSRARRSATPAPACCSPSDPGRALRAEGDRQGPAHRRSRCRTPCCTTSASPSPRRRCKRRTACSAPATRRLGRQSAVRHLSRARAAGPTTTSTSTPAAPIPSTGSGCWG